MTESGHSVPKTNRVAARLGDGPCCLHDSGAGYREFSDQNGWLQGPMGFTIGTGRDGMRPMGLRAGKDVETMSILKRATFGFVAIVLLLPSLSSATPGAASWRREVLLGANDDFYFVWVAKWSQPGSHYTSRESVTVHTARFDNNVAVDSVLVLAAHHTFIQSQGPWEASYSELPQFDLAQFLSENRIRPAFTSEWPKDVAIEDGALVVRGEFGSKVVLTRSEIGELVPSIGRDPHIVQCQRVRRMNRSGPLVLFFTIRFNTSHDDDDWTEVLIPVTLEQVQRAQ